MRARERRAQPFAVALPQDVMSATVARRRACLATCVVLLATLFFPPASLAAPTPCTLIGTDGADVLHGTASNDVICGLEGDDVIYGHAGDDTLVGGRDDDRLLGGSGGDVLQGGWGRDELSGQAGLDRYFGGDAGAVARFTEAEGPVTVDLRNGFATGDGGLERLVDIRGVIGSVYADTFLGGPYEDSFVGMGGNDVISGNGGVNSVSYEFASGPVQVDLRSGEATGADGHDRLSHIRIITGSPYDDTLIGNASPNWISGLGGNDIMQGRGSYDQLEYVYSPAGVRVDLVGGTAEGEGSDLITGFEAVLGTFFDDRLIGDGMDNYLSGEAGDNVLIGRGGNDFLNAGGGNGPDGNNILRGGSGDDELHGATGDDLLDGGGGIDRCLQGGGGVDVVENCETVPRWGRD